MARWGREVRRAVSWHRRLVAAALAGGAVAAGIGALAPAPPPTVPVLAAARDLAAGAPLAPPDLALVRLPPDAVPAGALHDGAAVTGRVLAGAIRRGEPLTDVRLVGASLLAGLGRDLVAAPVRIADAGAVRLLQPGDLVDVLAAETALPTGADDPGAAAANPASAARVVAASV
ncbi:MAG: SAF domain-containing protein, partial [Actinomycetota bacterium]|nr:SAF domain-containing protein [Actinomycetota bacterium]